MLQNLHLSILLLTCHLEATPETTVRNLASEKVTWDWFVGLKFPTGGSQAMLCVCMCVCVVGTAGSLVRLSFLLLGGLQPTQASAGLTEGCELSKLCPLTSHL